VSAGQGKAGAGVGRTVEEGGGVDAAAVHNTQQVPHLFEGPALGEGDDEADGEEHGVEDDRGEAELPEGFRDGCCTLASPRPGQLRRGISWRWLTETEIGKENGCLDAEYYSVVDDFHRQSSLRGVVSTSLAGWRHNSRLP